MEAWGPTTVPVVQSVAVGGSPPASAEAVEDELPTPPPLVRLLGGARVLDQPRSEIRLPPADMWDCQGRTELSHLAQRVEVA